MIAKDAPIDCPDLWDGRYVHDECRAKPVMLKNAIPKEYLDRLPAHAARLTQPGIDGDVFRAMLSEKGSASVRRKK